MNKENFGQFLTQTRKDLGMTQQDLAQQLHVTNTAVSKWERGLSYPDLNLFETLAQAPGLTVSGLIACQKQAAAPDDTQERSVRSLLDIVRQSSRRQRRKWLLLTFLLLAAALLAGGLLYYFTVLSVHGTSVVELPVKQAEENGSWIFIEKADGLLKLKCEDASLYDSILDFRSGKRQRGIPLCRPSPGRHRCGPHGISLKEYMGALRYFAMRPNLCKNRCKDRIFCYTGTRGDRFAPNGCMYFTDLLAAVRLRTARRTHRNAPGNYRRHSCPI